MATLEGADAGFANSVNSLLASRGGKSKLTSGYRKPVEQQRLWDDAVKRYGSVAAARKWVAEPGGSNHEHGFAADISDYQDITDEELAKHGLYRPMPWEPWHVEPIGYRGNKDAYTTPQSGNPAVDQTMQSFQGLLMTMGDDGSSVDKPVSTVSAPQSSVGTPTSSVAADSVLTSGALQKQQQDAAQKAMGVAAAVNAPQASNGTGGDIDRFMSALAGKESGGNYNAVNKDSGAAGKFQIMPGNWPAWSKEAGLPAGAARTPENQDRVARFKMEQYFNKFGNWRDVAIAWYGGEGAVKYSDSAKGRPQGAYPSINQYADDVMKRMG